MSSECNSASVVVITSGSTEIAKVPQRDLYRKYGWPAEKKIKDLLEVFKSMVEALGFAPEPAPEPAPAPTPAPEPEANDDAPNFSND